MCGICGIVDFEGRLNLPEAIENMTRTLAHRGPDGRGVELSRDPGDRSRVALGHTRLAIIDLSDAGRQPMPGPSGTLLVLNGEIYNFREKRAECGDYPFRSQSDTEVVLALYERHGENFVDHLLGMFALALWDSREGKLLLARDPAGKKPLYYRSVPGNFAFGSEIKALLALDQPSCFDRAALPLYLTYGYVPSPDTFYSGVKKLPAGSLLVVDASGAARTRRFWKYPIGPAPGSPVPGLSSQEAALRWRLEDAIRRRMVSDVPLGAFLSGGIDSSIIVGIMSRISDEPVRTFSIGFTDDAAYDESAYAGLAARRFRTNHTEFKVRAKAIDLIDRLVWHYDEPFGDSSAIPTYIVSELAREHVKVVLTGDGGDELFAGYERFAAALWTERIPRGALAAGRWISRLLPAPGHALNRRRRIKRFFSKALLPLDRRYLEWNSFFTSAELNRLLATDFPDPIDGFGRLLGEPGDCTLLQRILRLNFETYLLDDLLVKTDRMTMAHGLEARCPFLDAGLVAWAASLPDRLKIRRGCLKYLLKRSFRDLLPPEILARGKKGFGVPLGRWMRGDLRDYSHDLLLGPGSRIRDHVNTEFVGSLLAEHEAQLQDHGQKIWSLLTLEVWLRQREVAHEK
jgi:asparagine synthase (glutamine-hydrolysing)